MERSAVLPTSEKPGLAIWCMSSQRDLRGTASVIHPRQNVGSTMISILLMVNPVPISSLFSSLCYQKPKACFLSKYMKYRI